MTDRTRDPNPDDPPAPPTDGPAPPPPSLLDLICLMVGYGMASALLRAFWPSLASVTVPVAVVLSAAFAWLGLAMSGPIVLAVHRRRSTPDAEPEPRTWAELAWLIIGYYWLGLTVLVVPVREARTRLVDTAILGLFPIAAALILRFAGDRVLAVRRTGRGWTHRAAVGLIATWPLAWIALILLGKTLL